MVVGSPAFKRFGPGEVGLMRRMTGSLLPYSDVHPLGLLSWNTGEDGEMAVVNGNLALKLRQYDGEE